MTRPAIINGHELTEEVLCEQIESFDTIEAQR